MGFSVAWLAFHGKSKSEIFSQLSLIDTGEPDEANESSVSGAELPGDVYLLFLNSPAHPFTEHAVMARLSVGCDVLACQLDENLMMSSSFMYSDGLKVWDVTHISEDGKYHLAVEGKPPEILSMIRSEMKEAQDESGGESADVDCFFEVPIMLAMSFVGYRHDQAELVSGEQLKFTELVPA